MQNADKSMAVIEECKVALTKAKGKERAAIFERMGDAYIEMGKNTKALVCYREAVDAGWVIGKPEGEAIRIIDKCAKLLSVGGDRDEAIALLEKAMATSSALQDRAVLLVRMAYVKKEAGMFEASIADAEAAIKLMEGNVKGDRVLLGHLANAHNVIGIDSFEMGMNEKALDRYRTALGIFEELKDYLGICRLKNNIGLVYRAIGEMDKAITCFNESLAAESMLGFTYIQGSVFNNAGLLHMERGDFEQAEDSLKKGMKAFTNMNSMVGLYLAQTNLGRIYIEKGELVKAKGWLERAMKGFRDVHDEPHAALAKCHLADIALREGSPDKAARMVDDAVKVAKEHKDNETEAIAKRIRGMAFAATGDLVPAVNQLNMSVELLKRSDIKYHLARSLKELAAVEKARGAKEKAEKAAAEAKAIFEKIGSKHELRDMAERGL